jgi:hypothetical protein
LTLAILWYMALMFFRKITFLYIGRLYCISLRRCYFCLETMVKMHFLH